MTRRDDERRARRAKMTQVERDAEDDSYRERNLRAGRDALRATLRRFEVMLENDRDSALESMEDFLEGEGDSIRDSLDAIRELYQYHLQLDALRQVTGRTPEEAALYRAKADQLEAKGPPPYA
jgi:hypothetical protein